MTRKESARHAKAANEARRRFPEWAGLVPGADALRPGARVWVCGVGPGGTPASATARNAWKLWSADVIQLGARDEGKIRVEFAYDTVGSKRKRRKATAWIPLDRVACVPPASDPPPDDPPEEHEEVAEILCCRTYFGETRLLTRWVGYHDPMDLTWQPVEGDAALPDFAVDLCEHVTRGQSLDLNDPDVAVALRIRGDGHPDHRFRYVLDLREHDVVDGRVQLRLERSGCSVTMAVQDRGGAGKVGGGKPVGDRPKCDFNNSEMSNLTMTTCFETGEDDEARVLHFKTNGTNSPGNASEEQLEEGAKEGEELANTQMGNLTAPTLPKSLSDEKKVVSRSNKPTASGKERSDDVGEAEEGWSDDESEALGAYLWKITRGRRPASFGLRP